jgi:hypothetical protein
MPATYEKIATTTLSSANSTITFSTIPATYTDLRLVLTATSSAGGAQVIFRVNSDTGSNYSRTRLSGNGSTASSNRFTNDNAIYTDQAGLSTTIPHFYSFDIFSYAGSTNKTLLAAVAEDNNGSGNVNYAVGLWRNTAAITSTTLTNTGGDFSIGTTATLYGILKA